jgi:farnesyl diphosphate synthase
MNAQVTYQTSYGQLLDLTTAPIGCVDLSKYTLENYMLIVTYKTAYYSFYMPVACGMILAGIKDDEAFKVAEKILVQMGQYFQVTSTGGSVLLWTKDDGPLILLADPGRLS